MNPKISIIVPVYNVEKYLYRCIESILAQTFSDFELLLIDDGSYDSSGEICEEYALSDKRIKVLHLTNGGVSNARNTGIKLAKGKYLMFCDSDDYVEADWCKNLYEYSIKDSKAFPISGIKFIYNIGEFRRETILTFNKLEYISKDKYFETYKKGLSGSLCCKIYDRNIVTQNSLYFDTKLNRGEDLIFNLSYVDHISSFVTIPLVSYNYIHSNENSLMNIYRKDLFDCSVKEYNAWLRFFDKHIISKKQIEECSTYYYLNFISILKSTFDERNSESLLGKLNRNHHIIKSNVFIECLRLADMSKEDSRYIRLLKTKNYYLVWFAEQVIKVKNYVFR